MSTATPSIVWFRRDLRIADNPALHAALERGGPVVPVFLWAPEEEAPWQPGGASRWWLHHSLAALEASLRALGSRLTLRRAEDSLATLRQIARECGAGAVFWNRLYDPATIERDRRIKAALRDDGLTVSSHNSALLFEPQEIRNKSGNPFQVFTPFWRACLETGDPAPCVPAPQALPPPAAWPASEPLSELALLPKIDWAAGMRAAWKPGEAGAQTLLRRFLSDAVNSYSAERDRPDRPATSRLSPHLHFGEIGPRQLWHAARRSLPPAAFQRGGGAEHFLRECGWREFAHHLLFHFPHTTKDPLRPEFAAFPWREDRAALRAWQRGRTGYPIVDAGMRELWETGWMHNRVRMIVASFLVKDLLLPWQAGAAWFWDTLVDASLANNTLGWQWTAGCGADAAPYFRIFNPITQGEKFDPEGAYVRRYVPELARLPKEFVHRPWEAPALVLRESGVRLGEDYPRPMVDHGHARDAALAALAAIKKAPAGG